MQKHVSAANVSIKNKNYICKRTCATNKKIFAINPVSGCDTRGTTLLNAYCSSLLPPDNIRYKLHKHVKNIYKREMLDVLFFHISHPLLAIFPRIYKRISI